MVPKLVNWTCFINTDFCARTRILANKELWLGVVGVILRHRIFRTHFPNCSLCGPQVSESCSLAEAAAAHDTDTVLVRYFPISHAIHNALIHRYRLPVRYLHRLGTKVCLLRPPSIEETRRSQKTRSLEARRGTQQRVGGGQLRKSHTRHGREFRRQQCWPGRSLRQGQSMSIVSPYILQVLRLGPSNLNGLLSLSVILVFVFNLFASYFLKFGK